MHRRETAHTVIDPLQGERSRRGIVRGLGGEQGGGLLEAVMLECGDELAGDLGGSDVIVGESTIAPRRARLDVMVTLRLPSP